MMNGAGNDAVNGSGSGDMTTNGDMMTSGNGESDS